RGARLGSGWGTKRGVRDCSADALAQAYGTTENFAEANWLLPDGRLVPRYTAQGWGFHHLDQVQTVCPSQPARGAERLWEFMRRACPVRVRFAGVKAGEVNVEVSPACHVTGAQRARLRDAIKGADYAVVSFASASKRGRTFTAPQPREVLRFIDENTRGSR
ncbi:MAG: hypothetical protein Q8S13_09800, partial [Dehalococcoidia bacterium]|nr:hypothetical protein [Dehalococcoidia bacterium]